MMLQQPAAMRMYIALTGINDRDERTRIAKNHRRSPCRLNFSTISLSISDSCP